MADFAVWGESLARAMGYDNMQFMDAYYDNQGKLNVEAVEASSLGRAIVKFTEEHADWEGSPADLMSRLNIIAESENLNINGNWWPKSPRSLSRKLKPLTSNLREGMGIDVAFGRVTSGDKKGHHTLTVRKISSLSSLAALSTSQGLKTESSAASDNSDNSFGYVRGDDSQVNQLQQKIFDWGKKPASDNGPRPNNDALNEKPPPRPPFWQNVASTSPPATDDSETNR
jgi:hypothetical protein